MAIPSSPVLRRMALAWDAALAAARGRLASFLLCLAANCSPVHGTAQPASGSTDENRTVSTGTPPVSFDASHSGLEFGTSLARGLLM